MDVNAKMAELEALWQDSFDLCRAMIASCKSGDQKLTGSLLKEINAFIKQSVDFLKYREAEQVFETDEEEEDEQLNELLKSVIMDLDGESGDSNGTTGDNANKDDIAPLDIPDDGFSPVE